MSTDTTHDHTNQGQIEIPELPASEDAWIGVFNPTRVNLKLPLFTVTYSYLILEVEKGAIERAVLSTHGQVGEDFPLEYKGNSCTTTDRVIAQKLADEGYSVVFLKAEIAINEFGFWRRLDSSKRMKNRLCALLKSDVVFRIKDGNFTDIQAARQTTGETPYFKDGFLICSNIGTALTVFKRTWTIPEIVRRADL